MRQQMMRLGLNVPLMTSGGTFSETYIKITGDAAEGTLASFWGLPMDEYPEGRGLAFEKAYTEAKFNNPYEAFGPMAYAAGEVFVQAIQAAAKNGGVTREKRAQAAQHAGIPYPDRQTSISTRMACPASFTSRSTKSRTASGRSSTGPIRPRPSS